MMPDILIVCDPAGFHLLHGHLHLAFLLGESGRALVDVKGHGPALVSRTPAGLVVEAGGRFQPLLPY